ncbi:Superkiller protein 3 [Malassezia sp. CBS 17886]|nr:Superkiller protein 3 [Malassezia sp. CBS 17886]
MSNNEKALLKQCRVYIQAKDWQKAADAAASVLQSDPENYNALVFRGLSLLQLGDVDGSERAYRAATERDAGQVLAWQGLTKLYREQKKWEPLQDVDMRMADIYLTAGDAKRCAQCLGLVLELRRKVTGAATVRVGGGHASHQIARTLELFLPDSKYYALLATLPAPDLASPGTGAEVAVAMLMHSESLANIRELIKLNEKLDSADMDRQFAKQKSTLAGAKLGVALLRDQITASVLDRSKLPMLYELVLAHPRADDDVRRDAEAKLLQHLVRLTVAVPLQGPCANPSLKDRARAQTQELARGMVILRVADELAWRVYLEWGDWALDAYPFGDLFAFTELFPRTGRSRAARVLLRLVDEPQYREQSTTADRERIAEESDLLQLAQQGYESARDSILCQRVLALLYLQDKDYASAQDIFLAAQKTMSERAHALHASFPHVDASVDGQLATVYAHLHPPQHHKTARALAEHALSLDHTSVDATMALAYMDAFHGRAQAARDRFSQVLHLFAQREGQQGTQGAAGLRTGALALSPDRSLEAAAERAWCVVQLGEHEAGRDALQRVLDAADNEQNVFGADFRARLWWRLGRCYWAMGGTYRTDAAYAYQCFVAAIKRSGTFGPAFTALGEYYETVPTPPDVVRASKCFQKAFELDATEYEAARRLVEQFANQREWGLVGVIARRVAEAEGGAAVLSGKPSGAHVTRNAWVWKAIGINEALHGEADRAIAALQVTLRAVTRDVDAWLRLGEAYVASGRALAALKSFVRAQQLYDSGVRAEMSRWHIDYDIADAQRALGQHDKAVVLLGGVLRGHPEQTGVRAVLAETRLEQARGLLVTGYAVRAHAALFHALHDAAAALQQDKLLRSAWKVAGDACYELSKLDLYAGARDPARVDGDMPCSGIRTLLHSLVLLLGQLDTDARLPGVAVVTTAQLAHPIPRAEDTSEPLPHAYLRYAALFYKYLALVHAMDPKAAPLSWADLAAALCRLSWVLDAPATAARCPDTEGTDLAADAVAAREQAVQCVRVALNASPQAHLWLLLGNLHFFSSAAISQHAYIMAVESSGRNPVPWTNLGFLYLHHGDYPLAEQAFLQAQTIAPDWPSAWLGRAIVLADKRGDLRWSASLYEHAYLLSDGSLRDADYGLGLTAFHQLAAGPFPLHRLFVPMLALNHMVAQSPRDDAALHLSALLAEQLGAEELAAERIEAAAALLEAEYEATESTDSALRYGLASMNLGRIRLVREHVASAVEAFEAALALLEEESTGDEDSGEEAADADLHAGRRAPTRHLSVTTDQLHAARVASSIGLALARYMNGEHADAVDLLHGVLGTLQQLPASTAADIHAHIAVLLARMQWRSDAPRELITDALDTALAVAPMNELLITTRVAVAAAHGDLDQYNQVIAKYVATLPADSQLALRNSTAAASLSVLHIAASYDEAQLLRHLAASLTRPDASVNVLVLVAETLVRVSAGCAQRGKAMPRLALPDGHAGRGDVVSVAAYVLEEVRARAPTEGESWWPAALRAVTLAQLVAGEDGDSPGEGGADAARAEPQGGRVAATEGDAAAAVSTHDAPDAGTAHEPRPPVVYAARCVHIEPATVASPLAVLVDWLYYVDVALPALLVSVLLAVAGFSITYIAVDLSRSAFLACGLGGIDLLKRDLGPAGTEAAVIPESLGLPCAAVYLFLVVLFIPFRYFGPASYGAVSGASDLHQNLSIFLCALLSVYSATLLGFVDDVLDIRWRYKLPIPLLSSIPMLVVYMAGGGGTSVVLPAWPAHMRTWAGSSSLDLGVLYYVYMMLLATFCTNCINILAGINGVEVGQALVIAASMCVNDLLYLDLLGVARAAYAAARSGGAAAAVDTVRMYHGASGVAGRHLFSLHLLLPFLGACAGLLVWNAYPSRVFVGDTFCYFSGMVLVSCGILGHYSKTLLLFFMPQIFNFLLSCPQLFGLIPCARHRVPNVDKSTRLLYPSCVRLSTQPPLRRATTAAVLCVLERASLVRRVCDMHGRVVGVTNLTLLNAVLVFCGTHVHPVRDSDTTSGPNPALRVQPVADSLRISEHALWYYVMGIQVLGSCAAFAVRYWLASVVFPRP